jgi:hypothetical protein
MDFYLVEAWVLWLLGYADQALKTIHRDAFSSVSHVPQCGSGQALFRHAQAFLGCGHELFLDEPNGFHLVGVARDRPVLPAPLRGENAGGNIRGECLAVTGTVRSVGFAVIHGNTCA